MQKLGLGAKCGQGCPPDNGSQNSDLAGPSWLPGSILQRGTLRLGRAGDRASPKPFPVSQAASVLSCTPRMGLHHLRQQRNKDLEPLEVKARCEPLLSLGPDQGLASCKAE